MYLYLSSFLLGNRANELVSLTRTRKAAVVANALDNVEADVRREYAQGQIEELTKLGFQAQEVDLRDYFRGPSPLARRLNDVGLVWVTGGNAFLLRRAMKQSGFDAYILERKGDDTLVYGGFSAGACVAAPTLRGLHLVDVPEACAEGYANGVIWDGLGLVPYSIAPHFKSDHSESARVDAMVQYFVVNKMPFVALRDGDVVISVAG
jgi:dipeptidase E